LTRPAVVVSTMSTGTDRLAGDPPEGRDWWVLLAFVVGVNVVGAVPAVLGGPDSAWFDALTKPALYPPPATFGVVWTVLFTLLGVALYLVWRADATDRRKRLAYGAFAVQMACNVAWTPTFFALQRPAWGLVVVGVLASLVAATIVAFDRVDRRAAVLLVPYLAWVLFATYLNYEFWLLNA
jgi:benzodiazapine receptor